MGRDLKQDLVLHTFPTSPFAQRVAIALKEKGLSYEEQQVDLVHKSEEFLALNPVHKQVPVLVHLGRPVVESSVIVEYIDEVFPSEPHLIPRDSFERSVARFWVEYVNRFAGNLISIILTNGQEWEKVKLQSVEHFKTLDKALADPSRGKPYFFGNQLGIVDICFAPFAPLLRPLFEKLGSFQFPTAEECPRIYAWMAALEKNPNVVATAIDLVPCVALAQTVFDNFRHKTSWSSNGHLD